MHISIGNRAMTIRCVLAIMLLAATGFAQARLFGGDWYFPREQTITRGRHGLSAAELAPIPLDDDPETRRTIERMSQHVSVDVKDLPLPQFAKMMASKTGLQIILDHKALDEASITEEQPIMLQVDDVPLRQALRLALEPLELQWEAMGKIVLLTSAEKARYMRFTVVYPVFDLVVYPHKIEKQPDRRFDKRITTGVVSDFDTLMTLLQETITPDSWEEAGGPGRISPFPASCALVISQTREAHEQIEQVLTALRKARAIQQVENYVIASDNAASKETLALVSRSLGAPRPSRPRRIRHQRTINRWQLPCTGE